MPELIFDLHSWARPSDAVDEMVLDRCIGPTLDVGCGPGRMVMALAARGIPALGIDLAPEAVRAVRAAGGLALERSIFGPLPGEGRWPVALLLDGCLGIGGSPLSLLTRLAEVLAPDGVVYVEHDPDPDRAEITTATVVDLGGRGGGSFPWAIIGLRQLESASRAAGLRIAESWTVEQRAFAALRPRRWEEYDT
ncbi:MAG TPA: methyltransferase domain-containing protein [Actinopolymorphaceae bacterium]